MITTTNRKKRWIHKNSTCENVHRSSASYSPGRDGGCRRKVCACCAALWGGANVPPPPSGSLSRQCAGCCPYCAQSGVCWGYAWLEAWCCGETQKIPLSKNKISEDHVSIPVLLSIDLHSVALLIVSTRGKLSLQHHKSEFYEGDKKWGIMR